MSERQADPRCICGAPHSDPLHAVDHQFVMATNAEEAPMSTETTTRNLRERARQAAEQHAQTVRERAARDRAEYVDRSRRAGASTFQRLLGVDTAPDQWTPEGDGTSSDRYHSATAMVDGLKFRTVETYSYEVGYSYHLYLLRRCDNPLHPPHNRQTEISSLADLHDALQEDSERHWRCFTCERHAYEEREACTTEAAPEPEPTPAEQLVAAIAVLVRDEITAAQERGEF